MVSLVEPQLNHLMPLPPPTHSARRSHLQREGKHADGVLLMEVWQMKRMLGSARRQLQTYIDSHADAADLGDLVVCVAAAMMTLWARTLTTPFIPGHCG